MIGPIDNLYQTLSACVVTPRCDKLISAVFLTSPAKRWSKWSYLAVGRLFSDTRRSVEVLRPRSSFVFLVRVGLFVGDFVLRVPFLGWVRAGFVSRFAGSEAVSDFAALFGTGAVAKGSGEVAVAGGGYQLQR